MGVQSKDQRRSEGMTGFKEGNKCLLLFASIILTLWTTQSEGLNLDHLQPSFENIEYNETPQVSLQDLERANDLVSRDYLIEFLQQLRNRGPEIRPMETYKKLQKENTSRDVPYYVPPLHQPYWLISETASSSKRGIDFGLGRGFSGSQAAKHFLGMAAARYSGGPGKRAVKRSH